MSDLSDEGPADPVDVELQEVRGPLDLDVGADLDALHAHLELLAVEVDVAEVQNRSEDLEYGFALFVGEAEHLHGRGQRLEVVAVVFAINGAAATLEGGSIINSEFRWNL